MNNDDAVNGQDLRTVTVRPPQDEAAKNGPDGRPNTGDDIVSLGDVYEAGVRETGSANIELAGKPRVSFRLDALDKDEIDSLGTRNAKDLHTFVIRDADAVDQPAAYAALFRAARALLDAGIADKPAYDAVAAALSECG